MKRILFCVIFFCMTSILFGESIRVSKVTPLGETLDRDSYSEIVITFNEDIIPFGSNHEVTEDYLSFNVDIEGEYRFISTRTLKFIPSEPFPPATTIKATLKKGLKSIVSGNKLEKDYTWEFNTLRPTFVKSSPYNDRGYVIRDTDIVLYFSMPMSIRDAKRKITILENSSPVEFDVRYAKTNDLRSWETREYTLESVLVVTPKSMFDIDSNIVVVMDDEMLPLVGDVGTMSSSSVRFYIYPYFDMTSNTRHTMSASHNPNSVGIEFTTEVNTVDFFEHLEITPEVNLSSLEERSDYDTRYMSVRSVPFEPNVDYTIKIKKGLEDIHGQVLATDRYIYVSVSDYDTWINIPSGLGVVEAYEGRKLPLTLINPNEIIVKSRHLKKDEIIPYLFITGDIWYSRDNSKMSSYLNKYGYLKEYSKTGVYAPNIVDNRYMLVPMYLDDYLDDNKYGLLSLRLETTVGYNNRDYETDTYIQVTDMGVTGKFAGDSNTIFVTDLKTGRPVSGANVEVRDDYNNVIATAKTDKNGIATTAGFRNSNMPRYSKWNPPRQWVIVEKGDDIAFLHSDWGTGISPWRMNINYDEYQEDDNYMASMFTERGIYKPGETVHIKGVIRESRNGKLIVPNASTSISYTITDSRDDEILAGTTEINEFGSFLINHDISSDAPTGYYTVRATYEDDSIYQNFRVDVFKPLEFETRIWAENKKYYLNDDLMTKLSGWYLFGEPMVSNTVNYDVSLRETYYTPPNNTGFRFTSLRWFEDEYYSDYYTRLSSGVSTLNEDGEFSLLTKMNTSKSLHSANVTIEATIDGEDSQRVSASKSILVHGSDYYFGLRRDGYFLDTDEASKIEIVATDADGIRLAGKEANVTLIRRHWESVKRAITGGRFEWESKQVDTVITNATIITEDKPVEFEFTPKEAGLYFVTVKGVDDKNRQVRADEYMYVLGGDYVPWAMYDDDLLELILEKEEYKIGETAKVMLKNPYESATALITIEREFVIDRFVMEVNESTALIEIPIEDYYAPNVYVGVALIKGRVEDESYTNYGVDEGMPGFKIGYASINIPANDKKLNVEVIPSSDEYEPGDDITVEVFVKDAKNKETQGEIMFSVVDLGVLNLIGYKTPNWFSTFYSTRMLGVTTADTRLHLIGQRNYGEKGEVAGGDGVIMESSMANDMLDADVFNIRKNFLTTAYYNGQLITDEKGYAKVSFKLPDNITTFRIMASAVSKDELFGASKTNIIVKKNLMLMATLPEFSIIGDKFSAGATLYNYSSEDLEVTLNAVYSNLSLENNVERVTIPKGESKEIRFNFTATNVGEASVRILAEGISVSGKGDTYRDAFEKTFEVNFPPNAVETFAVFSSTTNDTASIPMKLPDLSEIIEGSGSLESYLSQSIFSETTFALDYLVTYPYLCLEQQLSRIYPLITSSDIIADMEIAGYTKEYMNTVVSNILNIVPQYQLDNGSFAYYTSKSWASPWLTVYALDALTKAYKAGYAVNTESFNKALNYVRNNVTKDFGNSPYFHNNEYINLASLAYASAVLSENGIVNKTVIERLYRNAGTLPFYALINLMRSMYYADYDKDKFEVVQGYVLNSIKEDPNTAHYELSSEYASLSWIHSSSVRETALALDALIEVGYDSELNEKVMRWLLNAKKNGIYLNTQDNVTVFAAVNRYYKKYESVPPDFKSTIMLENKLLLDAVFSSRKDKGVESKFSFSDIETNNDDKEGFDRINITKDGAGRVYYGIKVDYTMLENPVARDAGYKVERYLTTKDGRKLDLTSDTLKQGEEYIVTVKVNVPYERRFSVVEIPIAAGLRILNASFVTESSEVSEATGGSYAFNHTETYTDKVLLFADMMSKGEYEYNFVVRAATPGEYSLPPTKAHEMYNSEVFGFDRGYRIIIEPK